MTITPLLERVTSVEEHPDTTLHKSLLRAQFGRMLHLKHIAPIKVRLQSITMYLSHIPCRGTTGFRVRGLDAMTLSAATRSSDTVSAV